MSWSVTLPAKKFQLFQPIGGVCATTCGGAALWTGLCAEESGAGAEAFWAKAVNVINPSAANESEVGKRIGGNLLIDFRVEYYAAPHAPGNRAAARADLRLSQPGTSARFHSSLS